jgi:hypothetical protein
VSDAVFRSCFWLKSERDIVHRVVSWTLDVLLFLSNSGVGLFADQITGFDDLKLINSSVGKPVSFDHHKSVVAFSGVSARAVFTGFAG